MSARDRLSNTVVSSSGKSRRSLLKALSIGGTAALSSKILPEAWNRPVVASVMLPAHAGTSPPVCSITNFRARTGYLYNSYTTFAEGTAIVDLTDPVFVMTFDSSLTLGPISASDEVEPGTFVFTNGTFDYTVDCNSPITVNIYDDDNLTNLYCSTVSTVDCD